MKSVTTLLTAALMLWGGVTSAKAQTTQETDLTKAMFHVWDGVGADAQQTTASPYFATTIGATTDAGGVVYGNGNVTNTEYADITGYTKMKFNGTAGNVVRVLLNRQSDNSLTEKQVTIGTDGTAELTLANLDSYPYVHLNAIKATWGGGVSISRIYLTKEVLPAPSLPELDVTMFHAWDGVDATATQTSTTPNRELNLNTELQAGAVVFGNANVDKMEYADLSGYTKMVITGVAGGSLRVMFNRQADNSLNTVYATIGDDGRAVIDLTNLDALGYVHLNCIKVNWGNTATVSAIKLLSTSTVTIASTGLSSFSSNYNVTIPSGLTVYTAAVSGSTVKLNPLSGSIIPAQTGVVLKGTASTDYQFETTDLAADVIGTNDLTAANSDVPYSANCYVLSQEGNEAVFAPLMAGTVIPAGKAYIASLPAGAKNLSVVFGEVTAIGTINTKTLSADDTRYNMAGQRVDSSYKGIVIKDGKKFINR